MLVLYHVHAELLRATLSVYRLSNDDEKNLDVKSTFDHLNFESRFESGNLRKAIKVDYFGKKNKQKQNVY